MQSSVRALVVAVAMIATVSSCGDGPTENGRRIPASFTVVAGDGQEATVGTELDAPIVVRATDANGAVVAGAVVNFVITSGGGSVFAPAVTTNAQGMASNRWTLGPTAGTQTIEVRAVDESGEPVTYAVIEATGVPGAPASLERVSSGGLSGIAGNAAAEPLAVRVEDQFGNGVPGVTVTWAAGGGGSVDPATSVTNAEGVATTQLTLPPTVGTSEVTASVSGVPAYAMTATALVGSAAALEIVSGNEQRESILGTLAAPLVAKVTDAHGNAVAGATITWATNSGTITPATTTSNTEGLVSATWTLGTVAGVMSATATLDGHDVATFSATALAGRPITMTLVRGDDQTGPTGEALPVPLEIEVRDAHQNPVPDATVHWTVTAGGGSVSPATATTNAEGRATTVWTLGAPGANAAVARLGTALQVEFSATALAPTGYVLSIINAPGTNGGVGGSLNIAALLTTSSGAPVEGTTVAWRVAEHPDPSRPSASVTPVSSVTNASGFANTTLLNGTVAGTVTVEASVPNVEPATFDVIVNPGSIVGFRTGSDFPESGLAGSTITFDLEYTDQYGNAAPSAARSWTSLPGSNGFYSPTGCGLLRTAETDARNVARATWVLCSLAGTTSAYFNASGGVKPGLSIPTLGEPTTLKHVYNTVDPQGVTDWFQMTDAEGRPGGPPITFTITSGSGTIAVGTSSGPASPVGGSAGPLTIAPDAYGLVWVTTTRTNSNEPVTVTISAPGYTTIVLTR